MRKTVLAICALTAVVSSGGNLTQRIAQTRDIKVIYRSAYGHHPHGFEEGETTVRDFFRTSPDLTGP